jgi:hypothetical protein
VFIFQRFLTNVLTIKSGNFYTKDQSFMMWHCVVWKAGTDISEEPVAPFFRVEDLP